MSELALLGHDLFGEVIKRKATGPVAERFTFSPFTILDARAGEWQERKRSWLAMGIKSWDGRQTSPGGSPMVLGYGKDGERLEGQFDGREGLGDTCASSMSYFNGGKTIAGDSGSIFDPVLCEIAYRWFSPAQGQIVDPFCGGSVRGIVAKALGRKYWGCDLRQEQIAANIAQAEEIFDGYEGHSQALQGVEPPDLHWVCGDSMDTLATAPKADFVFSCPPYGDLEKYSNDPSDLSNMEWHTFVAAYKRVILRTVERMKPDTFACFVVGDFRDPKGFYRNFVSTTIEAFEDCGVRLYNEAILATAVGTAALRVTRQFEAGRKLVKLHQNVLVFCNGDWRKAAAKCSV